MEGDVARLEARERGLTAKGGIREEEVQYRFGVAGNGYQRLCTSASVFWPFGQDGDCLPEDSDGRGPTLLPPGLCVAF